MAHKHKQISKASFPPEIIREILLKVATAKSLLRCKSVCKEWYSLISDQHFIKSHYTLSSTNINYAHHTLIYNTYEYHKQTLGNYQLRTYLTICPLSDLMSDKSANNAIQLENPLKRTRPPRALSIVGSCNGLACLRVEDENTLFIYNPSTRKTNVLPVSNERPDLWCISYGFGFDEMTHDYKVVKLCRCNQTLPYVDAMIYSLKARSWKKLGCFPCANPVSVSDGKFLNGALHWATSICRMSDSREIVFLDLGKETYGDVLQPEYDEGSKILTLGVFGEWLCVLCNYYEKRVVDIWVMKVYGLKDSWTKLACIRHQNDRNSIPTFHALLCILNDRKLLLQIGTRLVVYDCLNSSYSEIQNFDGIPDTCIVAESLISPFAPLDLGDNKGDEN